MMPGIVCQVMGGCVGNHPEGSDLSAALGRGDIVVVDADLNRPVETIRGHSDFLSDIEQGRAKEYVRDRDRIRFIRRRIVLRRLMGTILGRDPRSIVIRTNPSGKPFVEPDGLPWPLSFSLSHSRDRVVYAFAREQQVGIDIEYYDPTIDVIKMGGVICAPTERSRLTALQQSDQLRAFYDCWCAKEAFIKAAGLQEPTSFEVSLWPQDPGLIRISSEQVNLEWLFHRLEVGMDWSAILVTGYEKSNPEYGDPGLAGSPSTTR